MLYEQANCLFYRTQFIVDPVINENSTEITKNQRYEVSRVGFPAFYKMF